MNNVTTRNPVDSEMRRKVEFMESEIRRLPQCDIPIRHYYSQGIYAREITIPPGALVTGKIHKYEQLNILSKGEISVLTQDGMKRVKAPFTVVSPAGTKRIAYAHEECVWTTVLRTDLTDPDQIEDHFTAVSEDDYQLFLAGEEAKLLEAE